MLNLVFGAGGASCTVPVTNLHIELRASRQLKTLIVAAGTIHAGRVL